MPLYMIIVAVEDHHVGICLHFRSPPYNGCLKPRTKRYISKLEATGRPLKYRRTEET
jgi:hypothetical protein